jgi:hypothetical protein
VGISLALFADEFSFRRSLLAAPLLIFALFGASLAIVELRDGVLRYRRLFNWTILRKDEIVSARVECSSLVGSIRLKRFLFPWGRLYFVLDANLDPNPFHRGDYPLLRYLRGEPVVEDPQAELPKNRAKRRQVFAAVVGALFYILSQLFVSWRLSKFEHAPPIRPPGPAWFEILWQLSQVLTSVEVLYIAAAVFTFLAIYQYRRPDAWIYAFLVGVSLPAILRHLLS